MDERAVDPFEGVSPMVFRSAAAQVADQIVQAIREGRLRQNDLLPSEREVARRFGVSRPTIREALAALELAGIVRSQKGKGTTVTALASQVATWGAEILPHQVFEARLVIEPQLAALAAEKRYPEDTAELRARVYELEVEFETTGTYESDLPVHRAIAHAARNPILHAALEEALSHTTSELWQDHRRRAFGAQTTSENHLEELRQVLDHIERGDAASASEVWRRHLVYFRDEMLGRRPYPHSHPPNSTHRDSTRPAAAHHNHPAESDSDSP